MPYLNFSRISPARRAISGSLFLAAASKADSAALPASQRKRLAFSRPSKSSAPSWRTALAMSSGEGAAARGRARTINMQQVERTLRARDTSVSFLVQRRGPRKSRPMQRNPLEEAGPEQRGETRFLGETGFLVESKGEKPGFLEKPGFWWRAEGEKPGFLEKPGFWCPVSTILVKRHPQHQPGSLRDRGHAVLDRLQAKDAADAHQPVARAEQ